jgi:prepilin-type N-terminal cleavage/methylation domain-containing protein
MKKNIKGFTLIELLVVIAIIGLLSTLAVVSLNSARQKARDARRQSDLRQISTAMELYRTQKDSYPICGGTACTDAGVITTGACGTTAVDICGTATTHYALHDSDGNVYIAQMPEDPSFSGTALTNYHYATTDTTGAASYCISADLEVSQNGSGYFMCLNGSCYLSATGC